MTEPNRMKRKNGATRDEMRKHRREQRILRTRARVEAKRQRKS